MPCHGQVLVLLTSQKPERNASQAGVPAVAGRGAKIAASAMAIQPGRSVLLRFPQEAVATAVRKLFPASWLAGVAFPMLEDLVNSPPFTSFAKWKEERGLDADMPTLPEKLGRAWRTTSGHVQNTHFFKADAAPQCIPLGLTPEGHYRVARDFARSNGLPFDRQAPVEEDADFAIQWTLGNGEDLRVARGRLYGPVEELQRRMKPITEHLLQRQPRTVSMVAGAVQVGFIAAAIVLTMHRDTRQARDWIDGFGAIGAVPTTGVFLPLCEHGDNPAPPVSKDELLAAAPSVFDQLKAQRVPERDEARFMMDEAEKDFAKNVASKVMWKEEVDALFGAHQWVPADRFPITQTSGKKRAIDNGRKFGHNAATSHSERMQLCNSMWPITVARRMAQHASSSRRLGKWLRKQKLETGGDDQPDAYR